MHDKMDKYESDESDIGKSPFDDNIDPDTTEIEDFDDYQKSPRADENMNQKTFTSPTVLKVNQPIVKEEKFTLEEIFLSSYPTYTKVTKEGAQEGEYFFKSPQGKEVYVFCKTIQNSIDEYKNMAILKSISPIPMEANDHLFFLEQMAKYKITVGFFYCKSLLTNRVEEMKKDPIIYDPYFKAFLESKRTIRRKR